MDKAFFAAVGLVGLYLLLRSAGAEQAAVVLIGATAFYFVVSDLLLRD